jgi:hypothetical protein
MCGHYNLLRLVPIKSRLKSHDHVLAGDGPSLVWEAYAH